MEKYDVAKPWFSGNSIKRGTRAVYGSFYYGAWRISYNLEAPGLIVYRCNWTQKRFNIMAGVIVVAIVVITISAIATGGATAPAYGLLLI